jgi:hypothetical protein
MTVREKAGRSQDCTRPRTPQTSTWPLSHLLLRFRIVGGPSSKLFVLSSEANGNVTVQYTEMSQHSSLEMLEMPINKPVVPSESTTSKTHTGGEPPLRARLDDEVVISKRPSHHNNDDDDDAVSWQWIHSVDTALFGLQKNAKGHYIITAWNNKGNVRDGISGVGSTEFRIGLVRGERW